MSTVLKTKNKKIFVKCAVVAEIFAYMPAKNAEKP